MNFQQWIKKNPGKNLNDFYAWKLKNSVTEDNLEDTEEKEPTVNQVKNQDNEVIKKNESIQSNDISRIILKYQQPIMALVLISTFLPFWNEQISTLADWKSNFDSPTNNFWGKISDVFDKIKIIQNLTFSAIGLFLSPLFILISMVLCFTKVFKISSLYDDFPHLAKFFFWLSIIPIIYTFFFDKMYFNLFIKAGAGGAGFYLIYIGLGLLTNVNYSQK